MSNVLLATANRALEKIDIILFFKSSIRSSSSKFSWWLVAPKVFKLITYSPVSEKSPVLFFNIAHLNFFLSSQRIHRVKVVPPQPGWCYEWILLAHIGLEEFAQFWTTASSFSYLSFLMEKKLKFHYDTFPPQ